MKFKVDENGKPVLNDQGLPIMIMGDGTEKAVDLIGAFTSVPGLREESKKHREKTVEIEESLNTTTAELNAAKEALKPYEGFDLKAAKEAMQKVADFSDKDLVEAGKVEEIRVATEGKFTELITQKDTAHAAEITKKDEDHAAQVASLEAGMVKKDQTIHDLMVTSQFAASPWFSGTDPKTTLPPEIAASYFSGNFKVEQGDDGKHFVVGYLNNQQIYSIENAGKLAGFDEALEMIIMASPLKDQILKSSTGGGVRDVHGQLPDKNPWTSENWNVTDQMKITKADPAKAKHLKSLAATG